MKKFTTFEKLKTLNEELKAIISQPEMKVVPSKTKPKGKHNKARSTSTNTINFLKTDMFKHVSKNSSINNNQKERNSLDQTKSSDTATTVSKRNKHKITQSFSTTMNFNNLHSNAHKKYMKNFISKLNNSMHKLNKSNSNINSNNISTFSHQSNKCYHNNLTDNVETAEPVKKKKKKKNSLSISEQLLNDNIAVLKITKKNDKNSNNNSNSIISEESVFSSKGQSVSHTHNNSTNSSKNKSSITSGNDLSFTYSDDETTRRNKNYRNIFNDKKEDFISFYEEMNKKLFGK